jgi:hypothetical protein
MPSNKERKYQRVISYIEDQVGADVNRDLIKVAINEQDVGNLDVDLTSQTGDPLLVTDDGSLAVASLPEPLDVSGSEVDVDLNSQTLSPLTVTDDGSLAIASWNAGTLPTEQQTPVGVEDSTGTQVDPSRETQFPDSQTTGHDLIGTGDLVIGPVPVDRSSALVIAANSTSGNTFSVSVDWSDGSGNVFASESASDLALSNITSDWSRLVRKGPQVTVTFTDTSGAAANNVNVHIDTQR